MLYFIVPAAGTWWVDNLLARIPSDVAAQIQAFTYTEVYKRPTLQAGTYCFTGLGVLPDAHRAMALALWEQLAQAGPAVRLLNHPEQALGRYDLLRHLYLQNRNDFQAYRIAELDQHQPRFPVFIRESRHHTGNLTELIPDQQGLDKALEAIHQNGYGTDDLLVIEYCDTGNDQGLFRKYSAFKVGDAILPRYLSISDYWMVKEYGPSMSPTADPVYNEDLAAEELAYLRDNPHEAWLRDTFALAQIDYGRIDYGVWKGKLQVWEINTMPAIGTYPGGQPQPRHTRRRELRKASKQHFYEQLGPVLSDLAATPFSITIPVHFSEEIQRQMARRRRHTQTIQMTNLLINLGQSVPRLPWLSPLRTTAKSILKQISHKLQRT